MKWNIVCDSACDIKDIDIPGAGYYRVPFIITSGEENFVDDGSIKITEMIEKVEIEKTAARSSCPSPQVWFERFAEADCSIAITISSGLSGSYNSALTAKEMLAEDFPDKKVYIVDTLGTSGLSDLMVLELKKILAEANDYETVTKRAQEFMDKTKIVFALCSYNNLIKNGRMNPLKGFIASTLGFWGVGIGDESGKIKILGSMRGAKKVFAKIYEDMETRGFELNKIFITHCLNTDMANELKEFLLNKNPDFEITIMETSGLNSFYAERGGLIVAYV